MTTSTTFSLTVNPLPWVPCTVSPVTIAAQTYNIDDPALVFSFGDFGYAGDCWTTTWTYVATLSDGTALPSFVTFTSLANGG
jgi:hypothetical protein